MATRGKKKTTMAKLNRESRLRERRMEKHARKEARKLEAAHRRALPGGTLTVDERASAPSEAGEPLTV